MDHAKRSLHGRTRNSIGRRRGRTHRRAVLAASLLARPPGETAWEPSTQPGFPEEVPSSLRSLALSAAIFRSAFIELAEGEPVDELLSRLAPTLELASRVVDAWATTLGCGLPEHDEVRP